MECSSEIREGEEKTEEDGNSHQMSKWLLNVYKVFSEFMKHYARKY